MKRLLYIAVIISIVIKFLPEKKKTIIQDGPKVSESKPKTQIKRDVAYAKASPKPMALSKVRKPELEIKDFSIAVELPNGMSVLSDHYAIATNEFRSEIGDKIIERNGMTIFRADLRPENGANVAFDVKNNKYYPVSSIIKLPNVDQELRQKLLALGFDEYYYHEALNIFYLQSTHDKVLNHQQDLIALKLNPELEIIRGSHRPR